MRLLANDLVEIAEDHILVLVLDDGTKVYLERPKNYLVPKVSWESVGTVSLEGKKEPLYGGMPLKKGTMLVLSEGYPAYQKG